MTPNRARPPKALTTEDSGPMAASAGGTSFPARPVRGRRAVQIGERGFRVEVGRDHIHVPVARERPGHGIVRVVRIPEDAAADGAHLARRPEPAPAWRGGSSRTCPPFRSPDACSARRRDRLRCTRRSRCSVRDRCPRFRRRPCRSRGSGTPPRTGDGRSAYTRRADRPSRAGKACPASRGPSCGSGRTACRYAAGRPERRPCS